MMTKPLFSKNEIHTLLSYFGGVVITLIHEIHVKTLKLEMEVLNQVKLVFYPDIQVSLVIYGRYVLANYCEY